jgi:aminocarboxymuconate-semialdehyde decarboxylase
LVDALDTRAHFIPRRIRREPGRSLPLPSIEIRRACAAVIVGGKAFRVIDCRSCDATRRCDDMVADDVDVQVVSPMPELLPLRFPPADTDALRRRELAAVPAFLLETTFAAGSLMTLGPEGAAAAQHG